MIIISACELGTAGPSCEFFSDGMNRRLSRYVTYTHTYTRARVREECDDDGVANGPGEQRRVARLRPSRDSILIRIPLLETSRFNISLAFVEFQKHAAAIVGSNRIDTTGSHHTGCLCRPRDKIRKIARCASGGGGTDGSAAVSACDRDYHSILMRIRCNRSFRNIPARKASS